MSKRSMHEHAKNDRSILPLRLEGVRFVVGGTVLLDGVATVIEAGRRTIVLGPNGAGKSLFLRLCHGLLQPSAGRVVWAGPAASFGAAPLRPKRHAMVFQRPVLLRRSALGNVVHALRLAGMSRSAARVAAQAALERFGLAALAERPARFLSGGEQQRLAIARALATEPQILFLDEPTASLDPTATRAIEAMVQAAHADGVTVVMSTHDLGQARRLADRVLFLARGRLLEESSGAAFFAGPTTAEAAAFVRGELPW